MELLEGASSGCFSLVAPMQLPLCLALWSRVAYTFRWIQHIHLLAYGPCLTEQEQ